MKDAIRTLLVKAEMNAATIAMELKISPKTARKYLNALIEEGAVARSEKGVFSAVKAEVSAATVEVDKLVDNIAQEVNTFLETPKTKEGKPRAQTVMGSRLTSRNATCSKMLYEKGSIQQKEISKISPHSSDWIKLIVSRGWATFDETTRTITITASGRAECKQFEQKGSA